MTSITEFRALCPSKDGARGPYPSKGFSNELVGASATKWHCQLDAGATQRVVVKLFDRNAAIQAENEAAKPKIVLITGHEPNIEQVGNPQLPWPPNDTGSSRYAPLRTPR